MKKIVANIENSFLSLCQFFPKINQINTDCGGKVMIIHGTTSMSYLVPRTLSSRNLLRVSFLGYLGFNIDLSQRLPNLADSNKWLLNKIVGIESCENWFYVRKLRPKKQATSEPLKTCELTPRGHRAQCDESGKLRFGYDLKLEGITSSFVLLNTEGFMQNKVSILISTAKRMILSLSGR